MNKIKIMLLAMIALSFISCTSFQRATYPPPAKDKIFVSYPKYRIDNKLNKICIIGNENKITSELTKGILKYTNIKVVEPGNIQSILGGKIIEYGTGLSANESQAIAQMLQVDHVILFEEKISPHQEYKYGGRAYSQINLKIVNTRNGEIIFQATSNYGITIKDPRPYGFTHKNEMPSYAIEDLRFRSFRIIGFQLSYALGNTPLGLLPKNLEQTIIDVVSINSPAYKAGIQEGDKILGINGVKIDSWVEYVNYMESIKPRQGEIIVLKIERNGEFLNIEVIPPVIPFEPEEPKREKPNKNKETLL